MVFDRAITSIPGRERVFRIFGTPTTLHVSAADSNGALGMWEAVVPPGHGVDFHTHTREDEMFYVLRGEFGFWCGADAFVLGPGGSITLPRQVRHAWRNVGGSEGQLLTVVTPGGFEGFFLEIERLGLTPADGAALAAAELRYGVTESAFQK